MPVEEKIMGWAELVVYLTDIKFFNRERIESWEKIFNCITVASFSEKPASVPADIEWHIVKPEESRSQTWNYLLQEAESRWVLFVEDDEEIRFNDLPEASQINESCWPPVLIYSNREGKLRQYYQMRFVPSAIGAPFEGQKLTDCTRFITENNVTLLNQPILIERNSDFINAINPEEELALRPLPLKVYLVQGEQYFREGKYVKAAAQYRIMLKQKKLIPFDRLAALNGLISCLTEMHKWPKALTLAETSVEAESIQRLPYLIQFRIHQLNKQWKEAFTVLNTYYDMLTLHSRVSFDKGIDEEETLFNLIEVGLKAGKKSRALQFFEELFSHRNGDMSRSLIKKILVLAIELDNNNLAVNYFNYLFEESLPDQLSERQENELDDYMTMFIKAGWYEFVSDIYQALYTHNPRKNRYRNRLIVAFSKMNKIEQARKLILPG